MKKFYGLTLLELLITLTIVGILLAVAIPSFSTLIKDSKLITTINKVNSLAALARSEAIKRNNLITLCRSSNGSTCASSGNYIIIMSDSNNDGDFSDVDDEMLTVFELIESNSTIRIYFQSFSDSQIVFTSIGSPTEAGRIEVCDDRDTSYAKATFINMGGQLRAINSSSINNAEENIIQCS